MLEPDKPSKTQRKKAMHELQALGDELVALSEHQLESMDLPPRLYEAVLEARAMTKHEARRRQMQFIGRLMREVDPGPIREQLALWHGQSRAQAQRMREIERWRERLLADDSALGEFAQRYGSASLQTLRACLREARRELRMAQDGQPQPPAQPRAAEMRADRRHARAGRAGRHFRELFRLLRGAMSEPSTTVGGSA